MAYPSFVHIVVCHLDFLTCILHPFIQSLWLSLSLLSCLLNISGWNTSICDTSVQTMDKTDIKNKKEKVDILNISLYLFIYLLLVCLSRLCSRKPWAVRVSYFWWHVIDDSLAHSPASLVLLPTLFLLLPASGWGAAKPADENKEREAGMTSEQPTLPHRVSLSSSFASLIKDRAGDETLPVPPHLFSTVAVSDDSFVTYTAK